MHAARGDPRGVCDVLDRDGVESVLDEQVQRDVGQLSADGLARRGPQTAVAVAPEFTHGENHTLPKVAACARNDV